MNKERFSKMLAQHVERLEAEYGFHEIHISFSNVCVLISHIQLALRHPANRGHAAHVAKGLVAKLIASLDEKSPGIGDLLRIGDRKNRRRGK